MSYCIMIADILKELVLKALNDISSLSDMALLEVWYKNTLGKYGFISDYNKKIKEIAAEARAEYGHTIQQYKITLEEAYQQQLSQLKPIKHTMQYDAFKPTSCIGTIHPLNFVKNQVLDMFIEQGYEYTQGPDIDNTYNNFDFLNTPQFHPARHDTDTFYLENSNQLLLRTHTTTLQNKALQQIKEKITKDNTKEQYKVVMCGNVYRRDSDATHSPMFTQFEGLILGKHLSAKHLKSWILSFIHKLLPDIQEIRLRPSFFTFTYCSAEVDIKRKNSNNWLELLGCGLVHPSILEKAGISKDYHGIAFGMGLERLTMLKYGINNLKLMHKNDPLWLQTFQECRY